MVEKKAVGSVLMTVVLWAMKKVDWLGVDLVVTLVEKKDDLKADHSEVMMVDDSAVSSVDTRAVRKAVK